MKKFLITFLVWLSIPLALAYATDYMITTGLRKSDLRKYAVWNDIYQGEMNPDVMAIGSSRVWCGYNTYIMDSLLKCDSYDLALVGHNFDFQSIMYDTYRRFNSKPKVILVNTDFLSTLGITSDKGYEREQFFPYIKDNTLISQVKDVKQISLLDRYLPLVRYFGYREEFEEGLESFFGRTTFQDGGMHKGYRDNNSQWERGDVLPKDTLVFTPFSPDVCGTLELFTKHSCEEGIQLVFVKSPVYLPLRDKFANIHQSDSAFESIANRYDIPILDYYFSSVCEDTTNFYSPGHLNQKGARAFTIELCHDLDSMGIIK